MTRPDNKPVKVLIVEDSGTVTQFLTGVLEEDPAIKVVGTASDGDQALEAVQRTRPDVITMDIHMPRVNGFEATRQIMEQCPTPIVIVSGSIETAEVATNFEALEAGALAVLQRPKGSGHNGHDSSVADLINTIKLMSEIKVVKRWSRLRPVPKLGMTGPLREVKPADVSVQVVAIGASTGGPVALQTVLSRLPRNFPAPILVVQHMTPGFTNGFVEWLGASIDIPIRQAEQAESLRAGRVYIAPDGFQMGVSPDRHIALHHAPREHGMCPAVSFLFRSVNEVFGRKAVGVLLTGMGVDGVDELKQMRNSGAVTIAQDKETSVVHGMPGQAIEIDAASHVLSPEGIARALKTIVTST